ncbi:DsbA family protein [Halobium salinum]|uniref:DsbA family protein n=1 Tax=Halobium salinum TaxID=1364940 RepID=A0ABD5PIE1_9EURY|nr:thioredoxin domain-containing protein [Halobium salinum]
MTGQQTRFSRRRILAGTGVAVIGSLAGCSSARSNESDGANTVGDSGQTSRNGPTTGGESGAGSASLVNAGSGTTGYDVSVDGNAIIGQPDATADLYYWSDYQCPFCKRFEEGAFPKLLENEVADGELRIVPLSLPNIGQASWNAAVMARCVWKDVRDTRPAAFVDWHRAVFDAQGEPNSGWASAEKLLSITESVDGADANAVESCYSGDNADELDTIRSERQRAGESGVGVTPGFVAYGRDTDRSGKLTGAQPYERFSKAVETVTE